MLDEKLVNEALMQAGSIRKAAPLLKMKFGRLRYWIETRGYKVEKRAMLVKPQVGSQVQDGAK